MIFIANESRGLITQAYAMTIATLKLVVNNLGLGDACRNYPSWLVDYCKCFISVKKLKYFDNMSAS